MPFISRPRPFFPQPVDEEFKRAWEKMAYKGLIQGLADASALAEYYYADAQDFEVAHAIVTTLLAISDRQDNLENRISVLELLVDDPTVPPPPPPVEPPPESAIVTVSGPATVAEANTTLTYTITIDRDPDSDVVIAYETIPFLATEDVDYEGVAGTVTFVNGGVDHFDITVDIYDDATPEDDENFVFQISYVSGPGTLGAQSQVTTTITDSDTQVGSYPDCNENFGINTGAMTDMGASYTYTGSGPTFQNIQADNITINTTATITVQNVWGRRSFTITRWGPGSHLTDCLMGPNTGNTTAKMFEVNNGVNCLIERFVCQNGQYDYIEAKGLFGDPNEPVTNTVFQDFVCRGFQNPDSEAHLDGFVFGNADGVTVRRGNFCNGITQWSTVAPYFQPYAGIARNCTFEDCRATGGQYTFRIHTGSGYQTTITNPTVRNSIWDDWALNYGQVGTYWKGRADFIYTGNTEEDTGNVLTKAGLS